MIPGRVRERGDRKSNGGDIGMFLYALVREICRHLRERSGFAAICVGIFVPVLKDHEWALIDTNFPGTMEPLYS